MEPDELIYDMAVIGGGLAGLSLAIQVACKGYKVILLEKEEFPFHRVCGEYISYESWDFLKSLGVDPDLLDVSSIKKLQVSGRHGKLLKQDLPLGGFGISRYLLDATLAGIAVQSGVVLQEKTKVDAVGYTGEGFLISAGGAELRAKIVIGSYGKRSNLDVKWKRAFITAGKNKLNNYIGVKYHIHCNLPSDTIALHNFKNGYCGIVKIEDARYCLCYLTTAANLQKSGNDLKKLERTVLSANPHLQKIFMECETLWNEPVVISQISFDKKSLIEDHVLLVGDAAGMITPLCGNGMSMAMHGSKMAAGEITRFLQGDISREQMEQNYTRLWKKVFASRLRMGRILQRLLRSPRLTGLLVSIGRSFPSITRRLIRATHGRPF